MQELGISLCLFLLFASIIPQVPFGTRPFSTFRHLFHSSLSLGGNHWVQGCFKMALEIEELEKEVQVPSFRILLGVAFHLVGITEKKEAETRRIAVALELEFHAYQQRQFQVVSYQTPSLIYTPHVFLPKLPGTSDPRALGTAAVDPVDHLWQLLLLSTKAALVVDLLSFKLSVPAILAHKVF